MSKKSKKQKRKEEAGRLGTIKRRIEAHQHKIGAKSRDKRVAKPLGEIVSDDLDYSADSAVEAEGDFNLEPPETDVTENYLWIYEPDDLDDMTVDQVAEVWEHREQLCGSKEAAAEALAIIEAASGVVESYQGWQAYIHRVEIGALKAPFLSDESEQSYARLIEQNALTRSQALKLDYDGLKEAWKNRPDSFSSVEAACQALALLREKSGVVTTSAWQGLMNHPEIEKIKDGLPSEDGLDDALEDYKVGSENSLAVDLRRRITRSHVVREGQRDFRLSVIDNYYGRCCISNSGINEILEAAHISPYSGTHSNRLDNSLCLRVDIHRLFDKFLLSIDPEAGVVKVSGIIKNDCHYGSLDGLRVTSGRVKASRNLLRQHFRTFVKRQLS